MFCCWCCEDGFWGALDAPLGCGGVFLAEWCLLGVGSEVRCESAWRERSCATSSEESLAAFTARVVGIVRRDAAKAPMASCSLEPCDKVSESDTQRVCSI